MPGLASRRIARCLRPKPEATPAPGQGPVPTPPNHGLDMRLATGRAGTTAARLDGTDIQPGPASSRRYLSPLHSHWALHARVDTAPIRFTGRGSPWGRPCGRPGRERSSPCGSPGPAGRNTACDGRFDWTVHPHRLQACAVWAGSANIAWPALYAGLPSRGPRPDAGMARLRPAFCCMFRPGFSTVPCALCVMALVVFRSSMTTVWAVSRRVAADWMYGRVQAPGALVVQLAQWAGRAAPAVGALLLPKHPALVPLALRVLDGRVGEGVYSSGAVGGLPRVAVNTDRSGLRGPACVRGASGTWNTMQACPFGCLPSDSCRTRTVRGWPSACRWMGPGHVQPILGLDRLLSRMRTRDGMVKAGCVQCLAWYCGCPWSGRVRVAERGMGVARVLAGVPDDFTAAVLPPRVVGRVPQLREPLARRDAGGIQHIVKAASSGALRTGCLWRARVQPVVPLVLGHGLAGAQLGAGQGEGLVEGQGPATGLGHNSDPGTGCRGKRNPCQR